MSDANEAADPSPAQLGAATAERCVWRLHEDIQRRGVLPDLPLITTVTMEETVALVRRLGSPLEGQRSNDLIGGLIGTFLTNLVAALVAQHETILEVLRQQAVVQGEMLQTRREN